MNVRAGIVVTSVFLGLFSVAYWTYAAGAPIGAAESVSYYFGALAALCMSVAMLLAARPRCAEGAFGGLDRMYRFHKYLGVASLVLMLAHLLGARVRVEGPYGRFDPLGGRERQVWIAGGIGITPFLSVMRSLDPEHGKTIHLYWCVREGKEAVFWDEMTQRAILGGVSLHRIETETGARLGIERLVADLGNDLTLWDYYLCGPRPMTSAISKGLRRREVPARQIHDEAFELR